MANKTDPYKVAVLVALYNQQIQESKTISSLRLLKEKLGENIHITIWNNGPKELPEISDDLFYCDIRFIQEVSNKPLSYVYNHFMDSIDAEKYVFFDQDTLINEKYIEELLSDSSMVSIPIIACDEKIYSPTTCSGEPISTDSYVNCKIVGIGSGICLRRKVKEQFISKFGEVFDSRFVLYGVDTTFFLRLHTLDKEVSINVLSSVQHSLSKMEKESLATKKFRKKERAYDLGLRLRYYFSLELLIVVAKKLLANLLFVRNEINVKDFFIALISGTHYRRKL